MKGFLPPPTPDDTSNLSPGGVSRADALVMIELGPKFTFDMFAIGPVNRFASAAARRSADSPGISYNPLFIYAVSGLQE